MTSFLDKAKPSLQHLLEAQHFGVHHSVADSSAQREACLQVQITHCTGAGPGPLAPLSPAWRLAQNRHSTGAGEVGATLVHIMILVCGHKSKCNLTRHRDHGLILERNVSPRNINQHNGHHSSITYSLNSLLLYNSPILR